MNINNLFTKENIETFATILGTLIFTFYMSFKTFKNKLETIVEKEKPNIPKNIVKQSNLDYAIIQEAENLKEYINADRIQVYEFHNGTHYANGRSALKTTCTYEICRYGIKSCLNILSGIPLSVIPNFLKELLDNGEILVKDLEDIKSTMPSTYNLKKSMDIKAFYDVVIHNDNNEPIGFVAVQFCRDNIKKINKDAVKKFAWFLEHKLSEMK